MDDTNNLTFFDEDGVECKDLLYSNTFIHEFDVMVSNSNYSVYAITGNWGTGKTCFVKMWEDKLKNDKKAFVHIDAFKMDYETEPFIMLIKAFKNFMVENNIDEIKREKWLSKAKDIFSIKNIAKLGFNVLVDKTVGSDAVKEFIGHAYDSCFEKLTAEKSLYDDLQSSLEDLLAEEKTMYIIIDELDRCRPDFALETLERIKHIFHVKNVKYILVYNEKIMMSIINKKYGNGINADRYLHKFVQKIYFLDNTRRLKQWLINEVDNSKEQFSSSIMAEFLKGYFAAISKIIKSHDLKLRDIQQILNNLKHHKLNEYDDLFMTIVSIEFLKHINKNEYEAMFKYYNTNNNLAVNAPERYTFISLLNIFKEQIPKLTIDDTDAFRLYMQYYEHR
jgi:hypothetical protein